MIERKVRIKSSSSDEIYTVTFTFDKDTLSIGCTCMAGLVKSLCKHRLALLEGDTTSLYEDSDIAILTDALERIDPNKIKSLYSDLNKVEIKIKELDKLRKVLRKEIGRKLADGF